MWSFSIVIDTRSTFVLTFSSNGCSFNNYTDIGNGHTTNWPLTVYFRFIIHIILQPDTLYDSVCSAEATTLASLTTLSTSYVTSEQASSASTEIPRNDTEMPSNSTDKPSNSTYTGDVTSPNTSTFTLSLTGTTTTAPPVTTQHSSTLPACGITKGINSEWCLVICS